MALVGALVVVLVGLLAREVAGRRVGVVAPGLTAVYPGFWINDGLLMAESLTTAMVAGALWATFRYRRRPDLKVALELGLWIGMASLARSESLLLAPLILVLAPWVVPNLVRFNDPIVMSTNDGLTLIGAKSPQTYSGPAIGFCWLEYANTIDVTDLHQSEVSGVYRRAAVSYERHNLSRLPAVAAACVGRVWSVYRPVQLADFNQGEGRELRASYQAMISFWMLLHWPLLAGVTPTGTCGQPRHVSPQAQISSLPSSHTNCQ